MEKNWDKERERLIRHKRRIRAVKIADAVINVVAALTAVGVALWLCYHVRRRPVDERAAYNEGRYGVDRATAVAMAERGIGLTAEDVLSTDYADFHGLEVR